MGRSFLLALFAFAFLGQNTHAGNMDFPIHTTGKTSQASADSKQMDYFKKILGPQLCRNYSKSPGSIADKVKSALISRQPSASQLDEILSSSGLFSRYSFLTANNPISVTREPVGVGSQLSAEIKLNATSSPKAPYNPGSLRLLYSFKKGFGTKGYSTQDTFLMIDGRSFNLNRQCPDLLGRSFKSSDFLNNN